MNSSLDLTRLIRPGDALIWTQTVAEPLTLTEALVKQRQALGPCSAFVGATYSKTLQPEHKDYLTLSTFGGFGLNHQLISANALEVIPMHCSQVGAMITRGEIPCDVAMLQLSPKGPDGKHSVGIAIDYILEAARKARVVIAEVNQQMPWTHTSDALEGLRIDAMVQSDRPLIEVSPPNIGDVEKRIAEFAAAFIQDRAVLELGLGAIPDAILQKLTDRRDLGIHSGVLGNGVVDLVKSGVITNAFKSIDTGRITAASLMGSQFLYDFARHNRMLNLQPYAYTHAHSVLSQIDNFTAVNSAIEVDLTGQVNAEFINGRYLGATGGLVDFVRGALASKGGRSIIALPSTAKDGSISRIVSRIPEGTVTSLRSDADVVVTEWGAAELRGQSLTERVKRMIKIAHPAHREQLERSLQSS